MNGLHFQFWQNLRNKTAVLCSAIYLGKCEIWTKQANSGNTGLSGLSLNERLRTAGMQTKYQLRQKGGNSIPSNDDLQTYVI